MLVDCQSLAYVNVARRLNLDGNVFKLAAEDSMPTLTSLTCVARVLRDRVEGAADRQHLT